MDDVKERLADAIGPDALAIADQLGDAAVKQVTTVTHELLTHGMSVVVEGFFQSDRYSHDFAVLTHLADSVHVHLRADDSILKHRYEQRALQDARHWIHGDREKLGTLKPELPEYMAEPLHLGIPQLVIDTTHHSVDIPATVSLILHTLQSRLPEISA